MITLTKLNDVRFVLNCDMIETVQENPDTTIHMSNGNLYIVKESMREVIDLTVAYRKNLFSDIIKGDVSYGKER